MSLGTLHLEAQSFPVRIHYPKTAMLERPCVGDLSETIYDLSVPAEYDQEILLNSMWN
jgi:hypothetical protein